MSVEPALLIATAAPARVQVGLLVRMARDGSIIAGAAVVPLMVAIALAAPLLGTMPPSEINPAFRNRLPGAEQTLRRDDGSTTTYRHWMGTDNLGRDVYSRVIYGARISLFVGISAAVVSCVIGLAIGLISGYVRWADGIIMRFMDGLMAIPAILLALALVSLFRAGVGSVIVAIMVPEVPRVARLVRSIVLSVRGTCCPIRCRLLLCRARSYAHLPSWWKRSCRSSAWASRRRRRAGATSWRRGAACSACIRTIPSSPASFWL